MILFSLVLQNAYAQDPQYTQYYNAPLYLNPAFVGLTDAGRVGTNYRVQGTNDDSRFTTFSLYGDYFIEDYNASAGVLLLQDKEEFNGFRYNSVAIPISYQFQINEKLVLKPALQGSFNTRRIDFSNILFGDQLDASGNVVGESIESLRAGNNVSYADLAFGILTYTDKLWAGASVHNILEQNISFVEGGNSVLPVRYSFHGGYRFGIKKQSLSRSRETIYMPTFSYVKQGPFDQLDVGLIAIFRPIIIGTMFRGVPIGGSTKKAVAVLAGVEMFNFSFGYSFDFVLDNATDPGGIHELSLSYLFNLNKNDPPGKSKRLRCPIPINQFKY